MSNNLSIDNLPIFLNLVTGRRYYSYGPATASLRFLNADTDRLDILKASKGKSGIYMWTNKLNGKKYIGSSVNLRRRFLEYYNTNRLLIETSMPINTAFLKYGYSNFSLDILEFCEISKLMEQEKHYFNKLAPEYNILKIPGSPSRGRGWKHTETSIEKMRLAAKNLSSKNSLHRSLAQTRGKNIEVTDLNTGTKTLYHAITFAARALAIDKRYIENYIYLKQKNPVFERYIFKLISDGIKDIRIQGSSQKLEVFDVVSKTKTIYPSISSAARSLAIRQPSISLYLKDKRSKPFKGRYIFKSVN